MGDWFEFRNRGAYGAVLSTEFSGFSSASHYVIDAESWSVCPAVSDPLKKTKKNDENNGTNFVI